MGNTYGQNIKVTFFGQSHSDAIGVTIEGLSAGFKIDTDKLYAFMQRRAPGKNAISTSRRESDVPEIICGLAGGVTCGAPLTAIIRNTDVRSSDYDELKYIPRPGHADLTAYYKYGEYRDHRGGGQFSGRLTAPMCIAGGILIQYLERYGIEIISRVYSIGKIKDKGKLKCSTAAKDFPTVDAERGELMKALIEKAKAEGDSVGGVVECAIFGLPKGIGDPMFDGMENRIASAVFAIPAVKGIEFGAGFGAAKMYGSENNDAYIIKNGAVTTATNNCGGILGGITNGEPLTFRAAFKPTPSIAKKQKSVDIRTMTETELQIKGRHDPCVAVRAVPCVESAAAMAVADALLTCKTMF